ncbi:predicted protein [Sclerotinia sclerotiorum 1980 UF-70]|uniref:Uncharacterized protein n=1 Tax=Sclerotinia sclerotiorum (strain ATCC 18683 / 1980 / Ss-1) TaxID=665079 RepID=A7EEA1_SCLS1|nr:predicted protein [Sclerotinia sclerotiorum 1980 UF-70]EDO01167.1 predicted protein [Sclerotinia sclerotiorum 1980 UF-70]
MKIRYWLAANYGGYGLLLHGQKHSIWGNLQAVASVNQGTGSVEINHLAQLFLRGSRIYLNRRPKNLALWDTPNIPDPKFYFSAGRCTVWVYIPLKNCYIRSLHVHTSHLIGIKSSTSVVVLGQCRHDLTREDFGISLYGLHWQQFIVAHTSRLDPSQWNAAKLYERMYEERYEELWEDIGLTRCETLKPAKASKWIVACCSVLRFS